MDNLLKPLWDFIQFIIEAVVIFGSSEEGKVKLTEILDKLEAEGIDIPFYEPSDKSEDGVGVEVGDTVFGYSQPLPEEPKIDRTAQKARKAQREASKQ